MGFDTTLIPVPKRPADKGGQMFANVGATRGHPGLAIQMRGQVRFAQSLSRAYR
ncbi:hypothetical protein [Glutamicibacter sp.]|uniref:hypothetical protein n=1 Tax=Glutamicibacter sp. TaxID=1931995 RepID=UPI003D6A49DD